jgi:hypothetical protein
MVVRDSGAAGAESDESLPAHRAFRGREIAVTVPVWKRDAEVVLASLTLNAASPDQFVALGAAVQSVFKDRACHFLVGEIDDEAEPAIGTLI